MKRFGVEAPRELARGGSYPWQKDFNVWKKTTGGWVSIKRLKPNATGTKSVLFFLIVAVARRYLVRRPYGTFWREPFQVFCNLKTFFPGRRGNGKPCLLMAFEYFPRVLSYSTFSSPWTFSICHGLFDTSINFNCSWRLFFLRHLPKSWLTFSDWITIGNLFPFFDLSRGERDGAELRICLLLHLPHFSGS